MKKRKKIEIITKAITEIGLCRCSFSYSEDFFYYYPNEVNKKFFWDKLKQVFNEMAIVYVKCHNLRKLRLILINVMRLINDMVLQEVLRHRILICLIGGQFLIP